MKKMLTLFALVLTTAVAVIGFGFGPKELIASTTGYLCGHGLYIESVPGTQVASISNAGALVVTSIANSGARRYGFTATPSLRWLHEGPVWKADAGLSYGASRIHFQDVDKGAFNGVTVQRNFVQVKFDDILPLYPRRITVLDPAGRAVDPARLENYSVVSATSTRKLTRDLVRQAYLNVRRTLDVRGVLAMPGGWTVVKSGPGTVTFSTRTEGRWDAAWVMVPRAREVHGLVEATRRRYGR